MNPRWSALSRWGRYLLGLAVAAALVLLAVPSISGIALGTAWSVVAGIPVLVLAALMLLWIGGLALHTITLTAALPSLSHRRALVLSLSGSAVANVLPLGGAAGTALNYRMIRGWGFGAQQFAAFAFISNVWDVLAKLTLPLIALPLVWFVGPGLLPAGLSWLALLGIVVVAAVLAVGVAVVGSRRAARRVGHLADRVCLVAARLVGSDRTTAVEPFLVATQAECRGVLATHWGRLTVGMTLYTAAVYALLWACLTLTGAAVTPAAVLVGFTAERLLTLLPFTPGGVGIVEAGLAGTLLLLGGDPQGVVAGVLLYRLLTFALEIPVGGATIAAWAWSARRSLRPRRLVPAGGGLS